MTCSRDHRAHRVHSVEHYKEENKYDLYRVDGTVSRLNMIDNVRLFIKRVLQKSMALIPAPPPPPLKPNPNNIIEGSFTTSSLIDWTVSLKLKAISRKY